MNRPFRTYWSLAWVILLSVNLTYAQEVPDLIGRVNDYAELLTNTQENRLEITLSNFEQNTSHQIVILTIESTEDYSIEEYANTVFNTWQLGQKENDNGVLILIAPGDRKMRIEVGYGLEGLLTDTKCGLIIRNEIAPYFKNQFYYEGISAGTDAVIESINDPDFEVQSPEDSKKSKQKKIIISIPLAILSLLGVFWITTKWSRYKPRRSDKTGQKMKRLNELEEDRHLSKTQRYEEAIKSIDYDVWVTPDLSEIKIERYEKSDKFEECSTCGNRTAELNEAFVTQRPTYTARGRGTKSFHCKVCKNTETIQYYIPKKRRVRRSGSGGYYGGGGYSGGGGFSGGGGSSGGGGASGGW